MNAGDYTAAADGFARVLDSLQANELAALEGREAIAHQVRRLLEVCRRASTVVDQRPDVLQQPDDVASLLLRIRAERMAEGDDFAAAELDLAEMVRRVPNTWEGHYEAACAFAAIHQRSAEDEECRQRMRTEALSHLAAAIEQGFQAREHLAGDVDWASLREEAEFKEILARLPPTQ